MSQLIEAAKTVQSANRATLVDREAQKKASSDAIKRLLGQR